MVEDAVLRTPELDTETMGRGGNPKYLYATPEQAFMLMKIPVPERYKKIDEMAASGELEWQS